MAVTAKGATAARVSYNVLPFQPPKAMNLPQATVAVSVGESKNADGSVPITVTSDAVALFVTLSTEAAGRFSENAFLVGPEAMVGAASYKKVVAFLPWTEGSAWTGAQHELLKATIRVEHLQENL